MEPLSTVTENEMEKFLKDNGYDILDEEGCVDSVKVSDIAIDILGYSAEISDSGIIIYSK